MIAEMFSVRPSCRVWGWGGLAALVVASIGVHARAEERKFAVMLCYSPKEQPEPNLVNFATIHQQYFDLNPNNAIKSYAEYWKEATYNAVTVKGQTFGWVQLPWRYHPEDASMTPEDLIGPASDIGINTKDKGGNTLPKYAYGAAEDLMFPDPMVRLDPDNNNMTPPVPGPVLMNGTPPPDPAAGIGDESYVWTPGERFLDLDGDGEWDGRYECPPCCNTPANPNACPGQPMGACCVDPTCNPAMNTGNIPVDMNADGAIMACPPPTGAPGEMWPPMGCECVDTGGTMGMCDIMEPFEDFMVRYVFAKPGAATPDMFPMQWTMVNDAYIDANYPGNKAGLKLRNNNNTYDSPDRWIERGNTKMINPPGGDSFATATPAPGSYGAVGMNPPPNPIEGSFWFSDFWTKWYGGPAPMWPMGSQGPPCPPQCNGMDPVPNTPNMKPFVEYEPGEMATWRYFNPNKGGLNRDGTGHVGNVNAQFANWDPAAADFRMPNADGGGGDIILPDNLGFYDGWVEHDDLASSKYHRPFGGGDQRLGEVTSPFLTNFAGGGEPVATIWGQDRGEHDPGVALIAPDGFTVAGGPFAINVNGVSGLDAGNVLLLEWLTWRTDGMFKTAAPPVPLLVAGPGAPFSAWELGHGTYHPYQGRGPGPPAPLSAAALNIGFRDYNLDGIIDQGEVRPPDSENYVVDGEGGTPNNGGPSTAYPWNRQRMMEDVMAALDLSVDFDFFNDANSLNTEFGQTWPFAGFPAIPGQAVPTGALSGVLLLPDGAQLAREWSLPAPSILPIHNQDQPANFLGQYNWHVWVHDIAAGLDNTGEGPAAFGVGAFQTAFAGHEYMHSWEGIPDLYDYDVYAGPGFAINHPVGRWCIMAGGGLVHPVAPLKADRNWIDPVDLRTIALPRVPKNITLPAAELFKQNAYLFYENTEKLTTTGGRERFWFWSAGKGFNVFMPGPGVLICQTDDDANDEGIPPQQVLENHFTYYIVQADGLQQLDAGSPPLAAPAANDGDAADPFPGFPLYENGANPNQTFGLNTLPASFWWDDSPSGLKVDNIQNFPDGTASLTVTWIPPEIPSLEFIEPPGGQSANDIYNVVYNFSDQYGGTKIRFYYTMVDGDYTMDDLGSDSNLIGCTQPGTVIADTVGWKLSSGFFIPPNPNSMPPFPGQTVPNPCALQAAPAADVPDGTYYIFARLIPGPAVDGTELNVSPVIPAVNNQGAFVPEGSPGATFTNFAFSTVTKLETWEVELKLSGWEVKGQTSGVQEDDDVVLGEPWCADKINFLGAPDADGMSPLCFQINEDDTDPFVIGDKFVFVTTGLTAHSAAVSVINGVVANAPIAMIGVSPSPAGPTPFEVTFSAANSFSPTGLPLTYAWNFGDCDVTDNPLLCTGAGITATHVYDKPGSFDAILIVMDSAGAIGQATQNIQAANDPPTAHILATPISGDSPLVVQFNGAGSSDPENQSLIFAWDFDDCDVNPGGCTAGDGTADPIFQMQTHTYTADVPTQFTVALTVTDQAGLSNTATVTITAGNQPPVAIVTVTSNMGVVPLLVHFDASASSDPDNPAGMPTAGLIFDWTFGDGDVLSNGGPVVDHTYDSPGVFSPKLKLTDQYGSFVTKSLAQVLATSVTGPTTVNPVASFTVTPTSGEVPLLVTFDASTSSDPGGATLTYAWDFGDDGTATGQIVEHEYDEAGGFVAKLTVSNGTNTDSLTRTIVALSTSTTPPSDLVIARISASPVSGVVPLTVNFSAGDSTPSDGTLAFIWDFGDDETSEDAQVSHTYAEPGTYTVTLSAGNLQGSDTATLEITANTPTSNRVPAAHVATPDSTGVVGDTITFDGNLSSDPDGDALTFTWEVTLGNVVVQTLTGARVGIRFDEAGVFNVALTVDDGRGGTDKTDPIAITIRASGTTGNSNSETPTPLPIPSTGSGRRTGLCGLGLVSLGAMVAGLVALSVATRKRRL